MAIAISVKFHNGVMRDLAFLIFPRISVGLPTLGVIVGCANQARNDNINWFVHPGV